MNGLIVIALIVAVVSSIAAWSNTHIILKDLAEIKNKMDIKEVKKPSFLDRDLDND